MKIEPTPISTPTPEFNIEILFGLCAPFFDSTPKKEDENKYDSNFLFSYRH